MSKTKYIAERKIRPNSECRGLFDKYDFFDFCQSLTFFFIIAAAVSGPCHFDNGDRVPLYWIWDLMNEDGYPRIIAVANTAKQTDVRKIK